ncbi:MAG: M67 family metallopeptidase [Candidatus Bathyarchaeia archaeon]
MTLIIKKKLFDIIVEHSLEEYPLEACGILLGDVRGPVKSVRRIFKARNILGSPSRYEIDPEDQLAAFSLADRESMSVIGFYHSHPYWDPEPSSIDAAMAFYRNSSYVIYSMPTRSIASFIWDGSKFIPEEVKII